MSKIVRGAVIFFCLTIAALPAMAGERGRALFVSVLQDPQVLSSRQEIERLIEFSKESRVKILFVQVYRADMAWFPSKLADDSPYREFLESVGEDPLALLIHKAHAEGIEVHAWFALLSMAENADAHLIKKYGPGILTRNQKPKTKIEDYKIDSQYFLEPGDPRVRRYMAGLVKEIVKAYKDLDGIQLDYIRYPDVEPHYGYTPVNIARFKKATGLKTIDDQSAVWQDWKRRQVTELVGILRKTAKRINPRIVFSTTGCMPFIRAYAEAFQAWPQWISKGLADYVTIMSYADNLNDFEKTVTIAKSKAADPAKIKVAVGAYKFIDKPDVFAKEFQSCERAGSMCAVFHYGSLLKSEGMSKVLKENNQ